MPLSFHSIQFCFQGLMSLYSTTQVLALKWNLRGKQELSMYIHAHSLHMGVSMEPYS